MAPKRSHAETESQNAVHESRKFQVPGSLPKPAKKARRTEPPIYRKQAHASSVNAIKKRIRDVTRRLERAEEGSANMRIEDERALATFQQELASAEAEKTRQKMIKKYHMVRFFERQKATRTLKKLRTKLLAAESTHEVDALKAQMHVVEVDLNYTQYCPLAEIYVSLYPKKESADDEEEGPKEVKTTQKPPMWAEVEKCMERGTLNQLRNRAPRVAVEAPRPLERRPRKEKPAFVDTTGMNRRERRSLRGPKEKEKGAKSKSMGYEKNRAFGASQQIPAAQTADEDDSDGGFFE